MIKKIHEAGAEAALYMIHAYVKPHENTDPEMIKNIKKMYIDAANQNSVIVMPVGIAFENAYEKILILSSTKSTMDHILVYLEPI